MFCYSRPQSKQQSCLLVSSIVAFLFVLSFLPSVMLMQNGSGERVQSGYRKMYFAIASTPSSTYSRAFNKTLSNVTQSYLNGNNGVAYNISLETLTVDLPEDGHFSATLLESLCSKFGGRHIAAVLIVGDSSAATTAALVAATSSIPVLWARNSATPAASAFAHREANQFEVHLQPTAHELLHALRALFIQTHWHTFTILADDSAATGMLLRKEMSSVLNSAPLNPTVLYLQRFAPSHSIFRRLADISRATRGVVILMSDLALARRVLAEAKRLNMVEGHFVWLWIDTDTTSKFSSAAELTNSTTPKPTVETHEPPPADTKISRGDPRIKLKKRNADFLEDLGRFKGSTEYDLLTKSDHISDMHVNYMLKNDKFLLFNRDGVESSKFGKHDLFSDEKLINKRSDKPIVMNSESDSSFSKSNIIGLPVGTLAIRALPLRVDRHLVKGAVRLLMTTLRIVLSKRPEWLTNAEVIRPRTSSCWDPVDAAHRNFSVLFARELKIATRNALAGHKIIQENGVEKVDKSLVSNFEITNLVPEQSPRGAGGPDVEDGREDKFIPKGSVQWRTVGHVTGRTVHLDTIVWPGGDIVVSGLSARARSVFRVVTALAPPFVMEGELDEDGQCLRGLPCHRVLTADKDNLTLVFNDMDTQERLEEEEEVNFNSNFAFKPTQTEYNDHADGFLPFQRYKYKTNCCYGLAMDLLENIAQELEFNFRLYIVADGLFGTKVLKPTRRNRDLSVFSKKHLNFKYRQDGDYATNYGRIGMKREMYEINKDDKYNMFREYDVKWNGIVGDLVSGAAHMSFAALSVSSLRSEVIDFSVPFFFSGVSFLAAPQQTSEIPLLAFLLPFSPELWIAIFTSLNITAIAVAVYEWLSPFGLNPWGRQRSKNFSMSSALWVMWGLLCGHLVAFKAPKSWPNKFLINVWGGFSVIFVASYTANIAALIAGLFFHNSVGIYHDRSLLSVKVGAPMASAADYYVQRTNRHLWDHMKRYSFANVEDGVARLKNGSLDILIADTPILDYYRATDHGCKLQKIGDTINEDAYAVGMAKGFPLKDSISAVIAKYASNGYMDILQEKWYGGLPCFKLATDMAQPRPLGVAAVAGVFLLLGLGMCMGCLILLVEHLFYRYTLPILRHKPKGTIWRSRNIMFFSQKLYRFINCVELVSPHHAARELVHTIRQGQITSLFQKSVKRKEHEQRRRRKSKAQFFEMIQEIRRVQQEERDHCGTLESVTEVASEEIEEQAALNDNKQSKLSPNILRRHFMRSNPKIDSSSSAPTTLRSPSKRLFSKPIFSPRSKAKANSSNTLNVRRFSTDSVFNSNSLKIDTSSAIGRRLSKDTTFLSSSPPDINSRRSSNLDVAFGPKFNIKSPVLSIENVSDFTSLGVPFDFKRKLSDAESIGRKLATIPKYKEFSSKQNLKVEDPLSRRRSDLGISKSSKTNLGSDSKFGSNEIFNIDSDISTVKSCHNIPERTAIEIDEPPMNISSAINLSSSQNYNLSDDEIARRNKQTINQLQAKITGGIVNKSKPPIKRTQSNNTSKNPEIRIEIEDTSKEVEVPKKNVNRKLKQRHRSLGESHHGRPKAPEHSQSLDSAKPLTSIKNREDLISTDSSRSRSSSPRCREHDLPPAPPPPNCSPRNSNGKSPLERLSKDELVLLWRSSESELRSHLLKALRDKDIDDPP